MLRTTTTKSGFHVTLGPRPNFKQYLAQCAQAGTPVPCLMCVDQNIWADVRAVYPMTIADADLPTKVIFRTQIDVGDGPGDMFTNPNPEAVAIDYMGRIMPVWRLNKAHYYAPINELDGGKLVDYVWHNRFALKCMEIAEQNGFLLALYAFSAGNPRDGTELEPSSLEEKWAAMLPSMQHATAKGHILLLHEYGFDVPAHDNLISSTLQNSAPHLALRHRRTLAYLTSHGAPVKVVLSEASAGVGVKPALQEITKAQWLADAQWYDLELQRYNQVIGCCWYQLGGAEDMRAVMPELVTQMQTTKLTQAIEFPFALGAENMFGLHGRSGSPHREADWQALRLARPTVGWYKLVTNTDVNDITRVINEGIQPAQIVMRLFFDTNRPEKVSPAQFVDWQMIHLTRLNAVGGRYVEVHNEPNLPQENNGQWSGPNAFSAWFNEVRALIKQRFPNLLVGMPGLSPQPNVPDWLAGCASAYQMCDWVGVHCYFVRPDLITHPDHGYYWQRFIRFGKPMIITEFSNPDPNVDKATKAHQYLTYVAGLPNSNQIKAAICFTVSNDGFESEVWVEEDGTISPIPEIIGAGNITPPPPPVDTLPVYRRVYVAIPAGLSNYAQMAQVAVARHYTVGPSLDDALIGDHLPDRNAIVIKPTAWNAAGVPALTAYRDKFAEYKGAKMFFADVDTPAALLAWFTANNF